MRRRTKSRTLTGQRIPIEMKLIALDIQKVWTRRGKRISLQDAYRKVARRFGGK